MLNALFIALVGMLIVFACLGAVLLVMIGINKLFKPKESANKEG